MKTASKQNSEKKNQVINDFGQKIGGAHKDRASEAAARLAGVDASALMLKPLAQVAKMPDFRALYLSGVITEDQARRGWYLWAQIGPKPTAQSWKVRGWAERAAALIESVANTLAYGVGEKSQIPEGLRPFQPLELFDAEMTAANWPADDYKRGAYFVGYYWTNPEKFSIHTAGKSEYKAYLSVSECVDAIRAKVDKNAKKGRNPQFCVYTNRAGYWISPNGKPAIRLAECDTFKEAWRIIADESEKLTQTFEELKKFPSERRDWNRPRLGADWRKGADLNPDTFAAVFPFRGVEFGNWVNQLERAACLNECADALQDMAQVLGILPDAVTLGGSLAWAFGSRGIGKALAHYEPARRVINLTKKKGNGCVAHEWFHALDNYIMIKAGKPALFMVSDCRAYGNAEKSPIFEAAEALKAALLKSDMYTRSKRIDEFKAKPYWATFTEMAARAFEAVIYYKLEAAGMCNDYLVNITPADEYSRSNCYPYPTREEAAQLAPLYDAFILAAFSEAERAPIAGGEAYEDSEKSQILEKLEAIREAILNESVSYGEITYLQDHAEYIKPDDTLLLEWAGVPEYPEDEAPAVAASEPMNEDSTDPTPADGVQGAAYGPAEKSQISENLPTSIKEWEISALRDEVEQIARELGFIPSRYCPSTLFFLRDKDGKPELNSKGEALTVSMCPSYPAGLNAMPAMWYRKGYINRVLSSYWSVDVEASSKEYSVRNYDPTEKPDPEGRRMVIDFDWMLEATADNFRRIMEEILRRFRGQDSEQTEATTPADGVQGAAYGDSEKSQTPEVKEYKLKYLWGAWITKETIYAETDEEAIFDADEIFKEDKTLHNWNGVALVQDNRFIKNYRPIRCNEDGKDICYNIQTVNGKNRKVYIS